MKRYWTDEERAILREVYAAYPSCRGRQGAERSAALQRRLPGRTAGAIKNQILVLGLSVQKISLSGKVFEYLTRHGPMDVKGIAEILGTSPQVISHWLRTGIIPARWQSVILEKAKQLKVKIKPQDLIAA